MKNHFSKRQKNKTWKKLSEKGPTKKGNREN